MKLKRIQVVTTTKNKRVLQVAGDATDGGGVFHSITDLTTLRGTMMFNRFLLKRIQSPLSYKLHRRMDVAALMVNCFEVGEDTALNVDGEDDGPLTHNLRSVVAIVGKLAENSETTDTIMDLQGRYMFRYASLFIHLYGKTLIAQGVDLED